MRRIIDDYEVEQLVVGLPLTMAGDEGPQALRVRAVAASLATAVDRPAVLWDERLSGEDRVTLRLGITPAAVRISDPTTGVEPVRTLTDAGSLDLVLSDHPILIAIAPGRP